MKAFKGFDKDLKCRGFQYEVGKEYEQNCDPKCCETGFHSCENPLDVFVYYSPANSRFCKVETSGKEHKEDDKTSSSKIKIIAEISLKTMIESAIKFVFEKVDFKKNTGDRGASQQTGDYGASVTTGFYATSKIVDSKEIKCKGGIAVSVGPYGHVSAPKNNWIACAEWKEIEGKHEQIGFKLAKVDGKKIKANILYTVKNGKFVEVK